MSEPLAYLNGRFVPFSEACLPVWDMGVVHGAAVSEMTRTFRHRCFRLEDHLARLFRSLAQVGIKIDLTPEHLQEISLELVERNSGLLAENHELGLVQFVTAGANRTYLGAGVSSTDRAPTVCVHTFPLPFELWASKYETGQSLVIPSLRHTPPESPMPTVKSRSRLHWLLADQQARLVDREASALLLDQHGCLTETAAGNLFVVSGGRISTPTGRNILEGISRRVVRELARELGIPCEERDLRPLDLRHADEAFTSSTPYCLLPVTRLDTKPVGTGQPGPVFRRLVEAWNQLVGVDIIAQMRSGAEEPVRAL